MTPAAAIVPVNPASPATTGPSPSLSQSSLPDPAVLAAAPLPVDPVDTVAGAATAFIAAASAAGAMDAQADAVVAMSRCSREHLGGSPRNAVRMLSPVALDDTCVGLFTGNGGLLTLILIVLLAAFGVIKVTRLFGVKTWVGAMGMVRFPGFLLTVLLLMLNGFLACSVILADAGSFGLAAVGLLVILVTVATFPLLSFLLATRRHLPFTHSPKVPACAVRIFLHGSGFDSSLPPWVNALSVCRSYRFPSPAWSLTGFLSPLAMLPVILAANNTCVSLFIVAAVLHFLFAIALLTIRPRRVVFLDILHAVALTINGIIVSFTAIDFIAGEPHSRDTIQTLSHVQLALALFRCAHVIIILVIQRALKPTLNEQATEGIWVYTGLCHRGGGAADTEIEDTGSQLLPDQDDAVALPVPPEKEGDEEGDEEEIVADNAADHSDAYNYADPGGGAATVELYELPKTRMQRRQTWSRVKMPCPR